MRQKSPDSRVFKSIASLPRLLICLDYDGTLTPIVSRPSLARLSLQAKKTLAALARMPGLEVAVLSGRSLTDIEKLVGIKGLHYIGNHGLERKIGGVVDIDSYAIRFRGFILKLTEELRRALKTIPGVMIENKTYSLSVHYRNISSRDLPRARRIFRSVWSDFPAQIFFQIRSGKKVWEVRPVYGCSDKGKAVRLLIAALAGSGRGEMTTVYIGDDNTDEDAFSSLKNSDISIHVGNSSRTKARFRLRSSEDVLDFLQSVKKLRSKTGRKYVSE
ncbi:MAG: Trehalose-phosphate phosphatase [Candidatus Omnitrophica bacterium ADurb.Bin277]|nr:MAG: Trehalose-phosphate phosphatase [Candidatus Omnitrophica bacterium ADurb.Bin277]